MNWSKAAPAEREERNDRIVELRTTTNMTYAEIAAATGANIRTVHRVLRDAELTDPEGYRPQWPEDIWPKIEAWLREEEGSYTEASRTFGPGVRAIRTRFPTLGWRREQAGRWAGQVNRINHRLQQTTYANTRR